jgi:hypothetical protein
MKNFTHILFLLMASLSSFAQTGRLTTDQNPQYMQSQNKYMAMADSVTKWHTTTLQNTYKAYDFLEAKAERKAERINFRRNLRLERARRSRYYNNVDPYYNRYNQGFSPYYYNNWPYNRWRTW